MNLMGEYPEKTKEFLQRCLNDRMQWMTSGSIESGDGITDETHRVVENDVPGGGIKRHQQEYMEDSNCRLFRLGFTVEEAESLLSG